MIGNALFNVGDSRTSPIPLNYGEAHRNMTPQKTVRHNVNQLPMEEARRNDMFDDPVTFVRELSSLGVPEFAKFEKSIYRSRYLNTPECHALLNVHYSNLMTRYAPSLTTHLSKRSEPTLNTLSQISMFSSDHVKSLTVLVVLGNHHNLNLEGLVEYVLNVMRLVYRAVTSAKGDSVEKARTFYALLTNASGTGRVTLLYMLLLSVLEKQLWFSEGEVKEDEMYQVFSYMICCYVQEALSGEQQEYSGSKGGMVPPLASKADMFVRHLSVLGFVLKWKMALPSAPVLLSCLREFRKRQENSRGSSTLSLWASIVHLYLDPEERASDSFKMPRTLFDVLQHGNDVFLFTHVVGCLEHCFRDVKFFNFVEVNLSTSKFVSHFLFNIWRYINDCKDDIVNEMLVLANVILEMFPKTLATLCKHLSKYTYKDKGEALLTGNLGPDRDPKYTDGVLKSVEAIFNVALIGKSRLQMSATLFLTKILVNADITRALPRVNKLQYTNLMLELLSQKGHQEYSYYQKEYTGHGREYGTVYQGEVKGLEWHQEDSFISDLAKLTMMKAYTKYCWNDLVSCLMAKLDQKLLEHKKSNGKFGALDKQYNYTGRYEEGQFGFGDKLKEKYKLDRGGAKQQKLDKAVDSDVQWVLNYVKTECLGAGGKETLYSMLSSGTLPEKILSYETLMGMQPTADTLVMCGMATMYRRYASFGALFNKYLAVKQQGPSVDRVMYPSMNAVTAQCHGRSWTNYTLQLLDTLLTQYVETCDLSKQKLVNSLLATPRSSEVDKEKYSALEKRVKEYKSEAHRLREDYEKLAQDSATTREEYEAKVSKLKAEMTAVSEKNKNDLQKMREVVTKTKATLQHLEQALNAANMENTTLKQENMRVYAERDGLKSESSSLKNKLAQQKRELDRLPGLIKENENYYTHNKKLQLELDRKSEDLTQSNTRLESLYRMLIYLADKYKSSMEHHERVKEEVSALKHQVSQLTAKIGRLEQDLREKERLISDLTRNKSVNESELARLREEIARKEEAIASANRKAKEYKDKVETLAYSVQKKSEALQSIQHRCAEIERELTERRNHLNAIESTFNSRALIT
ncbi:uncharacterized protein TOT_020000050 [Theileria orientalis strain Shintoku]|uniref:Uncharacterized protein n=1 Tax=Theileria orientalis strain Shintoku TaxID=869250 RepID=J4DNY7_THEOR|nr:uncharacterized protein TOT_020000050 [Theileria orientalis strain Shintoku]PVC50529.1 hypothetical protein MACL_00002213 [Theileria orientalis]BAM39779.1 uncharacterized protein TOT_020000050 [Theileria orientalis strain Shintoku]|eukprot:XP_009690080.1 uncharacterized protein TOT_020000050 [Theileria orientalis strain Shintoku]